ncbi:MAG: hypothetical protein ABR582_16525 [Gemmatimonadaceae bacterium]
MTAKLSRNFYERLGDDIATELVDWFNAVDATYQSQLKEMNELSWERLKAHLDAELAKVRGDMSVMRAELTAEMAKMRAALRGEMDKMRADLVAWMFVFWLGSAGLTLALRFFGPK